MMPKASGINPQKEIAALKALVGVLWRRVDEATAVADTLRQLLLRHGVLPAEEIDAMLAEARKVQTDSMLKALAKGVETYREDTLRRLLEGFRGPKQ
jgi:hypothetical protein